MRVKIRKSNSNDIDSIYHLHTLCFTKNDQWYKSSISQYLNNGIVIEFESNIIGVLLQGYIKPCTNNIFNNDNPDVFEPLTDNGTIFFNQNLHNSQIFGIVMICIHPNYRGKGLAKKLILKHHTTNHECVCLNTRKSNINAFMLYKSMGYEHIAYIKNKYFLPNEDSIFMVKYLQK